jgi:hypothetical protein
MALSKSITLLDNFNIEVSITEAYIKIENIYGTKSNLTFALAYKKHKDDIEPFNTEAFEFIPMLEGVNFIAQGYEHLKTLPEFADAIDC